MGSPSGINVLLALLQSEMGGRGIISWVGGRCTSPLTRSGPQQKELNDLGHSKLLTYTAKSGCGLRNPAKPPISLPPLPQFKHKIRGGCRREGAATLSSPDRGKKRQLRSPPPRPPTKRRPGNQSGPLSRQGRLLGQRGRTRRPAPPPPTPNTCSQASPGAAPAAPREGVLEPALGRNSTLFSGKGS